MKKLIAEFEASEGKWNNIKLKELFTSSNGDFDIQKKHLSENGVYVVSSGLQNLGVIGKSDVMARVFSPNTITIDMFGNVFYRDFYYKMVTHARVFSLSSDIIKNSKVGLYLASKLGYLNKIFAYDNMASWFKIQNFSIILPYKNNEIDFNFMENYIRELEQERIRELERYLQASGLDNYELTEEEQKAIDLINSNKIKFKDFIIKDIFDIATGKDFIIGNSEKGSIPLVSHTNSDNGISIYVKQQKNKRLFNAKNTLALADRGVFYATTQDKNFHIGTRVKALTFKSGEMSEEKRLFFTTTINKLQIFFTEYLVNATDSLPDLKIKLPVNYEGKIDYNFMNTYIKAIEKLVIKNVVDWKDKIIKTTKDVCNK